MRDYEKQGVANGKQLQM